VSTDEQAETGYGLPFQVDKCQEYAARCGYILVAEPVTDDYTGKTAFRPGMNILLDLITTLRLDVVIIHRTDRLGRRASVQDILEGEIEARGARVEYVTATYDRTTAQGRGMRRVQGVFDELDYEVLVEKLRDHKYAAVKRGSIIVTRPPYGYCVVVERNDRGKRIGNRLEVVDEEAHIVQQIFDWYINGDEAGQPLSITAITDRLTAQRIPTRGDSPGGNRRKHPVGVWCESHVNSILRSETYIGRWHYRKTKCVPIPGSDKSKQVAAPREEWLCVPVPAIIGEETFKAAQQRAQRNAALAKRNRRYDYLFSGMLSCSTCSTPARRISYVGQHGYRSKRHYRCSSRRTRYTRLCHMPNFGEAAIDQVVWQWIKEIVCNPEQVVYTLEQRQQIAVEENKRIQELIKATDRLIADKHAEQERVLTLYKRGKLDEDRWEAEDVACQQEIDGHEKQRAELAAQLVKSHYTPEYLADVKAACASIAMGIEHFNLAERRKTYELLEFHASLAVEDGMKVAYVECVLSLDIKRLEVEPASAIAFSLS
jgi:site-specific DNA recombinase